MALRCMKYSPVKHVTKNITGQRNRRERHRRKRNDMKYGDVEMKKWNWAVKRKYE